MANLQIWNKRELNLIQGVYEKPIEITFKRGTLYLQDQEQGGQGYVFSSLLLNTVLLSSSFSQCNQARKIKGNQTGKQLFTGDMI